MDFAKNIRGELLQKLLPDLSDASAETLEIIMDVNQVSTLFSSLSEVKEKKLISFEHAFVDLTD